MNLSKKLNKVSILLVDNDELIRDSLSLFFQCEVGRFLAVDSAEKGLEALKQEKYDVVISDFTLPKIDALSFFKLVEKNYPDISKVLITSIFTSYIVSDAIMIGVRNFIQKPFSTRTIEKTLYQLINNRNEHSNEFFLNGKTLKVAGKIEKNAHVSL
jgi:DNA-binding NtrC family response regulator